MSLKCPICSGNEQGYLFTIHGARIERCAGCGLVRSSREGSDPLRVAQHDWAGYETEADAARCYADLIGTVVPSRSKVLIVASGPHPLGRFMRKRGFEVTYCPITALSSQYGVYDCIVFLYSLEKLADPGLTLSTAHVLLEDHGALFIATPALDSPAASFFGRSWVHWRNHNNTFFTRTTMQLLLERCGFRSIWFQPDRRVFSLHHVASRLRERRFNLAAKVAEAIDGLLLRATGTNFLRFDTSGLLLTALKRPNQPQTTLSIIMPVYNERATVATTLRNVIAKRIEGISSREIIVVESNSTDGSREIVQAFAGLPGVKIVLEETPRGKGHAVRTGFEHATGEIILIQDADIEYDINDYDELLKPIVEWRELFILGSRHQGDWKMRTFTDNPGLAVVFNCGQIFFTWLMNTLYGQKMTDPFTMYKVFRRECLFGLSFECNRFDFDHELVIKLLRKGYKPRELPVNYWSRSYSEGKKVTIVGDPLTWIKANFKFKVVSPFKPRAEAYREAFAKTIRPSTTKQHLDAVFSIQRSAARAELDAMFIATQDANKEQLDSVFGTAQTKPKTMDSPFVDKTELDTKASLDAVFGTNQGNSPLGGPSK